MSLAKLLYIIHTAYLMLYLSTEQKCFELEKQLTVSNEKLQQESKSTTTLRQQVLELGESISVARFILSIWCRKNSSMHSENIELALFNFVVC